MNNDTFGLPQNVYDAFFNAAKVAVSWNIAGNRFELKTWEIITKHKSGFGYMVIYSTYVSDCPSKGRRLLRGLVKQGLLVEHKKDYTGQAVRFSIADKEAEHIIVRRAHDYYKSLGYVEGKIMDRVH